MTPAYKAYLKQVKQAFCCSRADQKHLLNGLEQEITETFPDADNVSMEQILEQCGSPEDIAQELQQVLPSGSVADFTKKRLHKIYLFFSLCLIAVVLIASGIIYREHIKAKNIPPDVVVVTQPPEIIYVTPRPPVVEYPEVAYLPE